MCPLLAIFTVTGWNYVNGSAGDTTSLGLFLQIYHDEAEELQEIETEDVLALQGVPEAEADLDDSDVSDSGSASEMSDDD